jgi:hypothetical protein
MIWTLLLGVGCGALDPTDCRYFSDCELYQPVGLLCGLSHNSPEGSEHVGSGCLGEEELWADPALLYYSSSTVSAGEAPYACPPGHSPRLLGDHEASDDRWVGCASDGNDDRIAPRLGDLPSGAACGLGNHPGERIACGDSSPNTDFTCPEGWSLRWLPDYFWDSVDETCASSEDGTPSLALGFVFFCELTEGCLGEECLDGLLAQGTVCGLHAWGHPYDTNYDDEPRDLEEALGDLFHDTCPEHPLREIESLLRAAATEEPRCLGKPVSEGCPDGLERACTWDQTAVTNSVVQNIHGEAWCWCAVPDAIQGEAAPEERP